MPWGIAFLAHRQVPSGKWLSCSMKGWVISIQILQPCYHSLDWLESLEFQQPPASIFVDALDQMHRDLVKVAQSLQFLYILLQTLIASPTTPAILCSPHTPVSGAFLPRAIGLEQLLTRVAIASSQLFSPPPSHPRPLPSFRPDPLPPPLVSSQHSVCPQSPQ